MRFKAALAVGALSFTAACGGGGSNPSVIPNAASTGSASVTSQSTPVPTAPPAGSATPPAPTLAPTLAPTPNPTPTPTATPQTVVTDSLAAPYTLTDNPNSTVGDPSTLGTFAAYAGGTPNSQSIDGLTCGPMNVVLHYHAHITVMYHGTIQVVPSGIGMYQPIVTTPQYYQNPSSNGCAYNLHIHSDEAVVHIESPSNTQPFNLKQFFDIWGVNVSALGFGPLSGQTRIFVTDESNQSGAGTYAPNEVTTADLSTVPLARYQEITVEVGAPFVPIPNYVWSNFL